MAVTDETPETTEQAKNNISPFLFAMMVLVSKKEDKKMQAIKTMELVKQYKNLTAVDKLHLEIKQGEIGRAHV